MFGAYRNIACITKAQGLNGEVVAVPADGLPFLLEPGMNLALTPPPLRGIRTARVESVRELPKGWGIRFEGVDSLDVAHTLVGRTCLAAVADVDYDFDAEDDEAWLGVELEDLVYGYLGEIVEVYETKAGYTWCVEGPYGEVLIPVADEYFVEELESGALLLDLPRGLVELNASLDEDSSVVADEALNAEAEDFSASAEGDGYED